MITKCTYFELHTNRRRDSQKRAQRGIGIAEAERTKKCNEMHRLILIYIKQSETEWAREGDDSGGTAYEGIVFEFMANAVVAHRNVHADNCIDMIQCGTSAAAVTQPDARYRSDSEEFRIESSTFGCGIGIA